MADRSYLRWPFLDDKHRSYANDLKQWAQTSVSSLIDHADLYDRSSLDDACKKLVSELGTAGWLRSVVPKEFGGLNDSLDVRTICLSREVLGFESGLADFAFAMQGLGSGPISLFGSDELKKRYLPDIATGRSIAAFAISEADAGSDVSSMSTVAHHDGHSYIINGEKTWISNAGIADHYVVFCRLKSDQTSDTKLGNKPEFIALVVDADNPGLSVPTRIDVISPHPLGTLRFDNCRVSASSVVGPPNKGLRVALGTLDVFRSTVGAAALGFARRAMTEALNFVSGRQVYGQPLSEYQLTRARLASMATDIDTSALLIYRAAWTRDSGAPRITREAAMAKWHATEAAQRVIDSAVQLFGGKGVVHGETVEQLYREIRALRIYEGTSEIQQLIIADQVLAEHRDQIKTGEPDEH